MKLIVGLGNPGKEYSKTRHNAGFMAIDELIKSHQLESKKNPKLKAEIAETNMDGEKIIIAKPLTYMNNSGEAVSAISNFYKIEPAGIVIVYDDLDLPLGQIRLREEGSAGTHNGMKSVVEHIGTTKIPRIRIGIESRGLIAPMQQDTVSFVLATFGKDEQGKINEAISKADKAIILAIKDFKEAMNHYN